MRTVLLAPLLLLACSQLEPIPDGESVTVPARAAKAIPEDVRRALQDSDELELLSLHPMPRAYDPSYWSKHGLDTKPLIADYAILGARKLEGNDRVAALNAFYRGVADTDGTVAACFNPRHALRASKGGATFSAVICYECLSMTFFRDGKRIGKTLTTESPKTTLNRLLKQANVPLPKR
ncbi:MAG: hypothetical protein ACYTGZ_14095 [Planctomycetota bacterium]|jgi:hypothetical protein